MDEEREPAAADARRAWIAGGLALALHAAGGLWVALSARFPSGYDELQHLSVIRWLEAWPRLFPDFERMRLLDLKSGGWTTQGNALIHPSPYYLLMAACDRALGGSVLGLRLVNLAMSMAATALLLVAGFRLLSGWKERAVFAALLVLFPKLAVTAGLINNDNGALIAVAIALLGLIAWQERPGAGPAALMGLGLALCGWSKLTVFLMMGLAALVAEALRLSGRGWRPPSLWEALLLGLGALVGAVPTLESLHSYGRPLFRSWGFHVPHAQRVHLGFVQYSGYFLHRLIEKWSAGEPALLIQQIGLFLILVVGAAAVALCLADRRRREGSAAYRIAAGLVIALVPTLLMHLYFGWKTFQEDGFLEMAQTRYYYGVWPGFALAGALLWRDARSGLARSAGLAALTAFLAVGSIFVVILRTLLAPGVVVG